jgi:hypothetical protein
VKTLFLSAVLALSVPAFAQVAKSDAAPEDQPALNTTAKTAPATSSSGLGTTVITGDGESPLGLYLTPWRESHPEANIDRPARLLQEEMLPIDKDVFERQVEYYDALSSAAKQKAVAP